MWRRTLRISVATCLLTASLLIDLPGAGSAHAGSARTATGGLVSPDEVGPPCDGVPPYNFAIMTIGPDLSFNNDRVVDVEAWSLAPRGRVHMWDYRTTQPPPYFNQRWCFRTAPSGWAEIKNLNSGMCLDKSMDWGDVNGAVVYQYPCGGTSNQMWRLDRGRGAGGGDRLMNLEDNRCLDIKDKVNANDASLQVWDCNAAGWNQSWKIVS
jgi:hypothetical protein